MILKAILLSIFYSFVSLITHLVLSHFRKGRQDNEPVIFELGRQTKLLLFIWIGSFVLYSFLFFFSPKLVTNLVNSFNSYLLLLNFIFGIILYLFLCFIYLTFHYLVERSVSATILEIIEYSEQKKLTLEQIKKIYNIEKKYENELKGMLEGSFIIKEADYYRNTLKGKLFAKVAGLMKKYLKLGPGG